MNTLSIDAQAQVLSALVEGNSIRATSRMTGAACDTILRLLAEVADACAWYQDVTLRNLNCKRIQCDEVWAFCYAKRKNVPEHLKDQFGFGDVWTWTAIDADTKLIPAWLVGERSPEAAMAFIKDLASRLANRVQLTTDGLRMYLDAVDNAFLGDVDYAMLVKLYTGTGAEDERRYSPAVCTGADKRVIYGSPDQRRISTSYIERQNLSMRMGMRRFTRLTNGFSRKVENLRHAIALHYMHYNFARIHKTLKTTPAKAAGIADHVWSLHEIARLAFPEAKAA